MQTKEYGLCPTCGELVLLPNSPHYDMREGTRNPRLCPTSQPLDPNPLAPCTPPEGR